MINDSTSNSSHEEQENRKREFGFTQQAAYRVCVCVPAGHLCTRGCSSCVETVGNKSLLLLFKEAGLVCGSYKVNERCCWDRKQDLDRMFGSDHLKESTG